MQVPTEQDEVPTPQLEPIRHEPMLTSPCASAALGAFAGTCADLDERDQEAFATAARAGRAG